MAWRSSNSLPWRSEEGVFKHEAKNNRRRGRRAVGRPVNLRGATADVEIPAWAGAPARRKRFRLGERKTRSLYAADQVPQFRQKAWR